jgi:hypothetical protein
VGDELLRESGPYRLVRLFGTVHHVGSHETNTKRKGQILLDALHVRNAKDGKVLEYRNVRMTPYLRSLLRVGEDVTLYIKKAIAKNKARTRLHLVAVKTPAINAHEEKLLVTDSYILSTSEYLVLIFIFLVLGIPTLGLFAVFALGLAIFLLDHGETFGWSRPKRREIRQQVNEVLAKEGFAL